MLKRHLGLQLTQRPSRSTADREATQPQNAIVAVVPRSLASGRPFGGCVPRSLFLLFGTRLRRHLTGMPAQRFTMLDCHDGILVQPALDGALQVSESKRLAQACLERGANLNRILSRTHIPHPGFDAHQIYCTTGRSALSASGTALTRSAGYSAWKTHPSARLRSSGTGRTVRAVLRLTSNGPARS